MFVTRVTIVIMALFPALALAQVGNNQGLLDPNLADREALEALPHVDASVANVIINGRPYLSATELDVELLGTLEDDEREELYGALFRQLDLNSAPEAEIMLIPGMSKKMAHEFEEYRPYASLEQFRREIGKYVDEDEVARLEQYIFIPMNRPPVERHSHCRLGGPVRRAHHPDVALCGRRDFLR